MEDLSNNFASIGHRVHTLEELRETARSVDLNRTLWGIAEEYMPETEEKKELVLAN